MKRRNRTTTTIAVLAGAVALAACGSEPDDAGTASASTALPRGSEPVELDPAEFTTAIDNPFWPMAPGARWIYREVSPGEPVQRVVVTVTNRTRTMPNGVEARIVTDVVTARGEPIEVTDDFYAQDADGNVWYLGEKTAEYRNGEVATRAGSFEAGAGGAQAGIAVPASPADGMAYRQEYLKGEAEDEGEVLSVDEQVQVATGHYTGALMTRDSNPLEPKISELKFYARDVGPVLTLGVSGGSAREELVSYREGG
jgi:hypothetical protein